MWAKVSHKTNKNLKARSVYKLVFFFLIVIIVYVDRYNKITDLFEFLQT